MTDLDDLAAELAELAAQQQHDDDQAPDDGPMSAVDRIAGAILSTAAIRALPPPEWLVEGYLTRDSLAMLYGPSGTYKTFLGIDLALHLATGSYWNGREVTDPSRVLYAIAEGVSGIGARLDAWQAHHGVYDLDAPKYEPVSWLPQAVNISDRLEAAALAQVAAELDPDLIVVDTLARFTAGVEENSARDMGLVVENLDMLRRATGACILLVHHTGKDAASGARGSSALRASMDTELEIAAGDPLALTVKKQKDAPEAGPLQLAVLPSAESVVLIPAKNVAYGHEVEAGARLTLARLIDSNVEGEGGVANGVWQAACEHCSRATFDRHRKQLVSHGLVTNVGTPRSPRYVPVETAADPDGEF